MEHHQPLQYMSPPKKMGQSLSLYFTSLTFFTLAIVSHWIFCCHILDNVHQVAGMSFASDVSVSPMTNTLKLHQEITLTWYAQPISWYIYLRRWSPLMNFYSFSHLSFNSYRLGIYCLCSLTGFQHRSGIDQLPLCHALSSLSLCDSVGFKGAQLGGNTTCDSTERTDISITLPEGKEQ